MLQALSQHAPKVMYPFLLDLSIYSPVHFYFFKERIVPLVTFHVISIDPASKQRFVSQYAGIPFYRLKPSFISWKLTRVCDEYEMDSFVGRDKASCNDRLKLFT